MEVNFFGAVAMIRAALPTAGAQSGSIVSLSVGGVFDGGSPRFTRLRRLQVRDRGMSEALSREVAGFGVKVMVAEPASLRTNFALVDAGGRRAIADYDVIGGTSRSGIKSATAARWGSRPGGARAS